MLGAHSCWERRRPRLLVTFFDHHDPSPLTSGRRRLRSQHGFFSHSSSVLAYNSPSSNR